jgi:hypothetical protein
VALSPTVDCLPHLVFVGLPKAARDGAVRLVAASVEDLLIEVTQVQKHRGIILIEDYEERSKSDEEGAGIVRDCCCGLRRLCAALYSWAADAGLPQTRRRRLSSILTFGPDL